MSDPRPIPYATPIRKGGPTPEGPTGVGWRTAAGAAWLAGVLSAAAWVVATLYDQQRALPLELLTAGQVPSPAALIGDYAGSAAFAVAVGAGTAAVLYHRTVGRLAWAAALPAVGGCWSALLLAGQGPTAAAVVGLLGTVAAQAGLVYAGTHLGRPLARWLTGRLVPPPLRPSLLGLWA